MGILKIKKSPVMNESSRGILAYSSTALNDCVDTENNVAMDITPFKNLLNDMYLQDISRKIRSSVLARQKQGKFTGQVAPYGYLKDPADHNHLIVDERYAPVVRRMFDMAFNGKGAKQIRDVLRAEKITRPTAALAETHPGYARFCKTEEDTYNWHHATVRDILRNPVYKGAVCGQRAPMVSFRSEKRKTGTKADPIIVEGMHEPIVDPEKWETVQRMTASRKVARKPDDKKYDNIFAGLLKCADCGYNLSVYPKQRKWNDEDINSNFDYHCNHYRVEGKDACSAHKINASDVHRVVLEDIKRLAAEALEDDKGMLENIAQSLGNTEAAELRRAEKEIKKAQKRLSELDRLFAKLYEDNLNDNISERNYKQLSATYEREQAELETKISEMNAQLKANSQNGENAANFVELIKEYSDITELTQALLNTLIDRIEVHEPAEIDGEYVQLVDIYYKFVGKLD